MIITPTEFVKDDVARFARINSRKIVVTYEAGDRYSPTSRNQSDELLENKKVHHVPWSAHAPQELLEQFGRGFRPVAPAELSVALCLVSGWQKRLVNVQRY